MAVIHMETETVRALAKRLLEQSQVIIERIEGVAQLVDSAPWQGGSREEFVNRLAESRLRFVQLGDRMQELHQSLNFEIDQWEEAASKFGSGTGGRSGGVQKPIRDTSDTPPANETPSESNTGAKYPSPPIEHELNPDADPRNFSPDDGCVRYAQTRRKLGRTSTGSADGYLIDYKDSVFQVNESDGDLTKVINEGYAVVWDRSHPDANSTHGHVAIVEEVGPDYVVVSHAGYKNNEGKIEYETTIPLSELQELWLIP